jgi:hypothetical protein
MHPCRAAHSARNPIRDHCIHVISLVVVVLHVLKIRSLRSISDHFPTSGIIVLLLTWGETAIVTP